MQDAIAPSGEIIGVIGAGTMGRGIAQVMADAAIPVRLCDVSLAAAAAAKTFCRNIWARKLAKGQLSEAEFQQRLDRLQVSADFSADLRDCSIVIEAVPEVLSLKTELMAKLSQCVSENCIVASNTSSFSIALLARHFADPSRVAGLHFFNPVPLMRVVEVISGLRTAPAAIARLMALVERIGHTAVLAEDSPGFVVNHIGRAYSTEALRIVSEGIAAPADVDRIMTEAGGFRMGPFTLFDLTGLDVSQPATESIYRQFFEDPRYRPVPLGSRRVEAGLLGRKTGEGFYRYDESGNRQVPPQRSPVRLDLAGARIWISQQIEEFHDRLHSLLTRSGATIEDGYSPSATATIFVTPLGGDATSAALQEELDPARTVAVDCLLPLERRVTLMSSPATASSTRALAFSALSAAGTEVTSITDSVGFVAQRILAMMVNLGCEIAQQKIGRLEDIDRAVELGLGYPRGPLALGDDIGPKRVLAILESLQALYGDPRYRPSPWLRRRAALGLPLMTPD